MNQDQQLGQLQGMLHETQLRVDSLHIGVSENNRMIMELLAKTSSATSRDALMSGLIGACCGAITGAMVAAGMVGYLIPILHR
ncbi:MAG: hypothetical protein HYX63_01645 [Gammaproteobacteria bacterium]|nr:hypothetical protein [Gammaproteobacteria bacterium]